MKAETCKTRCINAQIERGVFHHTQQVKSRSEAVRIMSSFRLLLSIACLLGLSCTAYAQNLTASTPPANLTVITQANNNFTNMALPSFPCSASSGLVGGYSTLDLDNAQNDDLYYLISDVFDYFSASTFNFTDCTFVQVDYLNVTNACSQVRKSEVISTDRFCTLVICILFFAYRSIVSVAYLHLSPADAHSCRRFLSL